MKNVFFTGMCLCFLSSCAAGYRLPPEVTAAAVGDRAQVVYSPAAGVWSEGGMAEDRTVFTRSVSPGTGSYSQYTARKAGFSPASTYEFLLNGRLIGYNQNDLYFTETVYRDNAFKVRKLSPEEVEKLFPGLTVVKISTAENGVLTVRKPLFGSLSFLLLNDTEQSYHRYSFEGRREARPFKSLLTADAAGDIRFSHFGSDDELFPVLTIRVEN